MPRTLLIVALMTALAACATTPPASKRSCYHVDEKIEKGIGYCQALRQGNTLYISGITASGPMPKAVTKVYDEIKRVLEANGLTFADVVKENVYATNLDAFIAAQGARKKYYGDNVPAATWVQVQRLYLKKFVLEVEVVAEYP